MSLRPCPISRIYGFDDVDKSLSSSCHVYERDDQVLTLQLHNEGLHSGFLFAENNTVTVVIDGDNEQTISTPDGSHRSQIVHVMYLNENEIVSASADGGVNLWSFADDHQLHWKNYLNGSRNHLSALQVTSAKHETGSIVATTTDGYLSAWSRETLMPLLSAATGNAPCLDSKGLYSVELFESAGLLVMGGFGRIYVHEDTNPFSHVTSLGGHRGPVLALASHTLSPLPGDRARDIIISAGEDKALVVWDANMFQEYTRHACAHASSITSITVLDTASTGLTPTPLLVSASRDGHIKIWSLSSLTLMHDIGAHQGRVVQVSATLSYGRFNNRPALLSTGADKHMKIWKLYRILNWKRRQHFAFFLAYCGFIKSSSVYAMPILRSSLSSDVDTGLGGDHHSDGGVSNTSSSSATITGDASASTTATSVETEERERRAVVRVFNVEFMCQEIISFL